MSLVDLSWLKLRLKTAGFGPEELRRELGVTMADEIGLVNYPAVAARLQEQRSEIATLLRLLFLEVPVARTALRRVFSSAEIAVLGACGLIEVTAGQVSPCCRLDPVGDLLIAADCRFTRLRSSALGARGRDPVYPPGADSLWLRESVQVGDAASVLDLCTGTGIQALSVAQGSRRVVAVDVNLRALHFARFNAALNGLVVDLRCGDLCAPVRGEAFDVVIANPPFVTSPYGSKSGQVRGAAAASYHSGGARGDQILRRLLRAVPAHLNEGGRLFAVGHVGVCGSETMDDIAARWFAGFPGRAAVFVLETGTPLDLAAAQSQFALARGSRAFAAEFESWRLHLKRHRITAVAAFLLAAERGAPRQVEVIDAGPKILPLPLAPPAPQRVAQWIGATEVSNGSSSPP